MGRQRNAKWQRRIRRYRSGDSNLRRLYVTLFKGHRKFTVALVRE